ncbi:MAG: IclR family transcriptional regulator C-terminal domain-containing protein [Pseudomonadota bacterium]
MDFERPEQTKTNCEARMVKMSGIKRYERILNLFSNKSPEWTVSEMSGALETSASTLYRLVRELVSVGMLESTVESKYRLGPLFIEYYRRIKLNDPLIRSGSIFLAPLCKQIDVPCAVVLARLYNGAVMCVADDRSAQARFETSYELGRPMPILRGATSKAVLSTMPPKVVRNFLTKKVGSTPEEISSIEKELAFIRKSGISETHGEVDANLVGVAAPVRNSNLGVNASVSLILEKTVFTPELRAPIYSALSATAKIIENFMEQNDHTANAYSP